MALRTELRQWAKGTKANNLQFSATLVGQSNGAREALRAIGAKRFSSWDAAWHHESTTPNSFLESLVLNIVTNGGTRPSVVTDPKQLLKAVIRNPYLKHFFGVVVFYVIALSRLWHDQKQNLDAVPTRDDWADISLALYTGSRDIVVSADKLVRKGMAGIAPTRRIVLASDL